MVKSITRALGGALLLAISTQAGATPQGTERLSGPTRVHAVQGCGWYIILTCQKNRGAAVASLNRLGGPGVGGQAGANVINTNNYPNFRPGWWCVADGPYGSRGAAEEIAWREAVPGAYVKSAC